MERARFFAQLHYCRWLKSNGCHAWTRKVTVQPFRLGYTEGWLAAQILT